jgi:hypothetical protein
MSSGSLLSGAVYSPPVPLIICSSNLNLNRCGTTLYNYPAPLSGNGTALVSESNHSKPYLGPACSAGLEINL